MSKVLHEYDEGYREGLKAASRFAALFTLKPDASIHPDIPFAQMNETAKMIAHTTAQQISYGISELRPPQGG